MLGWKLKKGQHQILLETSYRQLQCTVCNPYLPVTKSLISTSQSLPRLLKESIEARCAKRGLKDFIPMDHQSSPEACLVVHLKLGQLDIHAVDHRAVPVNTRGKKCFFASMMDVAVVVHHAQLSYYHGRTDRRGTGVDDHRTITSSLHDL